MELKNMIFEKEEGHYELIYRSVEGYPLQPRVNSERSGSLKETKY